MVTFPHARPLDTLRARIHDLRISVMDRCNFRCPYCMPRETFHERYRFLKAASGCDFEEIAAARARVRARSACGSCASPAASRCCARICRSSSASSRAIPGIEDIALTTNGVLLAKQAAELKAAGLKRITVSLDTLDPESLRADERRVRRASSDVLEGIERGAARRARAASRSTPSCSAASTTTRCSTWSAHFRGSGVIVRFIEYMDVGTRNDWQPRAASCRRASCARASTRAGRWPRCEANYRGEVAERYAFADGARRDRLHLLGHRSRSAATARARACPPTARSTPACSRTQGTTCARRCAPAPATTSCAELIRGVWSGRARPLQRIARSDARARTICTRSRCTTSAAEVQCAHANRSRMSMPTGRPRMVDVGAKQATQRDGHGRSARADFPPAVARALRAPAIARRKARSSTPRSSPARWRPRRRTRSIPFCHPLRASSAARSTSTTAGGDAAHSLHRVRAPQDRRRDGSADRRQRRRADDLRHVQGAVARHRDRPGAAAGEDAAASATFKRATAQRR